MRTQPARSVSSVCPTGEELMSKYVMVLNCGSSSAKFNLFEVCADHKLSPVVQGIVEEIGTRTRAG
jgi:hypothetical protein